MGIILIKELIKVLLHKYTVEDIYYFYKMGFLSKKEYDSLVWRKKYEKLVELPGGVELVLNYIPPGTFVMGSPEDELGRNADENQHQVTLTKGYWLGKYVVTQAQYEAVMGKNPSNWKGADLPVDMVSWDEAMEFCAKLTASEKAAGRLPEGYEYTLPTEAQWEYACRAGTITAFNNGKNIPTEKQICDRPCPNLDKVGWYDKNSGNTIHPVGQKQPNVWGLYDMHGNVWEWCLDWYGDYPISAVTDPKGPEKGTNHVGRGGSWADRAGCCHSAHRHLGAHDTRSCVLSFRICLSSR